MFSLLADNTPLFLTAAAMFGLLIGSFLNVVILRLPARMEYEWKEQCRDLLALEEETDTSRPPGILWDRSRCRDCGHNIRPWENVPLVSYLLLRGRCSACSTHISVRYPLVEALTAALFLATAWHFGPTTQCVAALALTGFLITMSAIDLDHQLLPDNLTLPLMWIGLLLSLTHVFVGPVDSIVGAAAGYLVLWTVYQLFRLLTGKEGMGYGDFKLLAALGAWLGWQMLPLIILLSSLLGATVGLFLMAIKRHQKDHPLPFGPFIAGAGWIALIWGADIIQYYLHTSGF